MSRDSNRPTSSPSPSSFPSRSSSHPPPSAVDLTGGSAAGVRFRPTRLSSADLPVDLACRFRCEEVEIGPLPVFDLAAAGFAASAPDDVALVPGSLLEGAELLLRGAVIWSGGATVVHSSPGRIGARLDSGMIDLQGLELQATFEGRLETLRRQRDLLPAEWRAAVSDVAHLLEDARREVEAFELAGLQDPLRRLEEETMLFERLQSRWGAAFYEALATLHDASRSFGEDARALGRSYAQSALLSLLCACPMHRRGYEKPRGYAGDYRLMELYFAQERAGDGLFGRFLHAVTQGYTLCRAVVGREALMRQAVQELIELESAERARVLSLAAGPAIELRRLLDGEPRIGRPVELILIDQDRSALETAHRQLTRLLVERHHGSLPVTVTCLHFSVRQILKPQTPEDRQVVDEVLRGLDLVYSAGLYDYLPEHAAANLTSAMYSQLRAGGRMLMGNLVEAPDTTWVMEFVLDWPLHYRTRATMLALAADLSPAPVHSVIRSDVTGHAIFLDVTRP